MDCKTEEEWYAWTEIANLQHDLIHIQEKAKALEMYTFFSETSFPSLIKALSRAMPYTDTLSSPPLPIPSRKVLLFLGYMS